MTMPPAAFKAALATLGRSPGSFAKAFGIDIRNVQRWAAGEREIPEYMRRFLAVMLTHPKLLTLMEAQADPFDDRYTESGGTQASGPPQNAPHSAAQAGAGPAAARGAGTHSSRV